MYAPLFGLTDSPFSPSEQRLTPIPETHKAVLTKAVFTLLGEHGVIELIAEGNGPIRPVVQYLVDQMPDNCRCITVLNPRLSQLGFLHAVCQQLAIPLPSKEYAASTLVNLISDSLSDSIANGETNVLILNDAHLASSHVFKQLLELIDPAPYNESLLQVVLVGHGELRALLNQSEHRALEQRVVRRFSLPVFTATDTAHHIQLRMTAVGWKGPLPFEGPALEHIHALSEGLPEKIDLLCDDAVRQAQSLKKKTVTLPILQKSLRQKAAPDAGSPLEPSPQPVSSTRRPWIRNLKLPKLQAMAAWSKTASSSRVAEQTEKFEAPTQRKNSAWRIFKPSGMPKLAQPTFGQMGAKRVWMAGSAVVAIALVVGVAMLAENEPKDQNLKTQLVKAQITHESDAQPHAPAPAQAAPAAVRPVGENAPEPAANAAAAPDPSPSVAPIGNTPDSNNQPAPSGLALPDLSTLSDDTEAAWVSLGSRWGLKLKGDSPCADALSRGYQCFRTLGAGMAALKSLDRPGLAQLNQNGVTRWLELTQWRGDTLTVGLGNASWQMSSAQFAELWTGRFTTFWLQPMAQTSRIFSVKPEEPAGQWLDGELQKLQSKGRLSAAADTASKRLLAFQQLHDLNAGDGKALPSTFIKANQLAGIPEPKLSR